MELHQAALVIPMEYRYNVRTLRLNPDESGLLAAAQVISRGGLVAFPTDTVYGLGADAFDPVAVRRVFTAKGRPETKPIPILLAEPTDVDALAAEVPDAARRLIAAFWPGALTLVLPARPEVPVDVRAGQPGVAVRLPDHPLARALVAACGCPLTGTSANLSDQPASRTADDVLAQLDGRIDAILLGESPGGPPSTVLDVTREPPLILRRGAVSEDRLRDLLGAVQV